jgi:hypothetical protein
VKTGGKQSSGLAEISEYKYMGNAREIKDSKSVPVGSPVGRKEPSVPTGCHTHPSEPTGDKNRIASLVLKRAVFAGLWKDGRSGKGAAGREPRSARGKSCDWVLGVLWRMKE